MLKYRVYLENYWEAQFDEFEHVDYTSHFTEDKPCNVYLVGVRPRVMVDPDSLEITGKDEIKLTFVIQYGLREFDEKTVTIKTHRELNGNVQIISDKPHSRFQIVDEIGSILEDDELLKNNSIEAKAFYVLRKHLSNPEEIAEINDFEVVYIGQSLKMDKSLSSIKRLKHHQKVQKVLEKCNSKYIYEEVYIILCSFVQKVSLIALGEEISADGGQEKLSKALADSKKLENDKAFRTNVAEAALIDYFDTREFNHDFIGTFGRKTHKYYPKLIMSSISEVSLEVDFSKLCFVYSNEIERKCYHAVSYNPHDGFRKTILDSSLNIATK